MSYLRARSCGDDIDSSQQIKKHLNHCVRTIAKSCNLQPKIDDDREWNCAELEKENETETKYTEPKCCYQYSVCIVVCLWVCRHKKLCKQTRLSYNTNEKALSNYNILYAWKNLMWKNAIRLRHAHSTQSFSCESENVNKERDGLHWVRVDEKKRYDRRTSSLFVIFYSFSFLCQFLCRCCNELNVNFHFRVHSWAFLVGEMSMVSEHSHLTHNWRGQLPVCAVKGIEYCRMPRFFSVLLFYTRHFSEHIWLFVTLSQQRASFHLNKQCI